MPLPPRLDEADGMAEASLEAARRKLPRRSFVDDVPDKGLFGVVAIIGFAGIFALKRNSLDASPIFGMTSDVIAFLAVGLMLAYGIAALRIPQVRMRPDRLGDNFYYLGFIFTLASLSAALAQFRGGVQINDLIGSFGIALLTTIVGIAGRVIFLQMRTEIDDVEEGVRRDLAATAADLRAQLGASIREFETFRTSLLQSLTETQTECARVAKQQVELIETSAKDAGKRVEEAFEANRRHSASLDEALKSISRSVKTASDRAAEFSLPNERLNSQIGEFATGLESVLARLAGVIEGIAQRSRRRWRFWPFGSKD
jgi:uncharacterized protein YukE